MTDKDRLRALLMDFGVEFTEGSVVIRSKEGDKGVSGYSCFYTDFEFDERGKFIQIGAWE